MTTDPMLCFAGVVLHLLRIAAFVLVVLLLFSTAPGAAAILDPVDFLALQSIRAALHDMPGSAFFASWDFAADPCSFSGVLCSGDRVVGLSLGDPRAGSPGLSGRLDSALGRLSALTELSLVPGHVTGPIPPDVGRPSDLRILALGRNYLSGPIPPAIGGLRRLRTLDLGFNQLDGPIPPGIAGIPTLSTLVLCHNNLSGPVPPFVDSPSPLVRLDLKHNNLTGALPALPASLQYLSLARNRLTGPAYAVLPRLDLLNHLDLSMNGFTGPIPPSIFSFPIADLRLQRNAFSGPVLPEADVAIPAIDLSYNQLSGGVSPLLAGARRLYLNNNRFTGEVPAGLVGSLLEGAMEVLYLQHNYLTGIEIDPAAQMPLGSSLCLHYNCMVPPAQTSCPLKAGQERTRPAAQCVQWRA